MLRGKKIILGITGSIAAYKSAYLIRELVKQEAEVQVVITPSGKEFITPVTLSALTGKPVLSEFFGTGDGTWHSHVDLGTWADLMIIAPASANTIAKMACGIADNLLLTTYLSAKCPVMVAPAMDLDMYAHPANQKNIHILKTYGNRIIDAGTGELASGLFGKGRMEEPEKIAAIIKDYFTTGQVLLGKKILVTCGPTFEKIDPVRYIGNFSSGKMGYAIAEILAQKGADVWLVSGPTSLNAQHSKIKVIDVVSAEQMYETALRIFPETDGAVLSAAVADYKPSGQAGRKLKRGSGNLKLELIPTVDIAASMGQMKTKNQILAGFALETDNELENARNKLEKKNLDLIVLNSLNDEGAGFQTDTNKVTIIDADNNITEYPLKSKPEVAKDIVEHLIKKINNAKTD